MSLFEALRYKYTLWVKNALMRLKMRKRPLTICGQRIPSSAAHYENTPMQIYRKFYLQKLKTLDKKVDIFHISAQNIDCGYSLEPPRRGGSNEYTICVFEQK